MTILLGLKYFSKIALYFYAQKYLTYINTTLPSDRQTHALISAILHTGEPKDGIITRRINMVQRESCGDLFLITIDYQKYNDSHHIVELAVFTLCRRHIRLRQDNISNVRTAEERRM